MSRARITALSLGLALALAAEAEAAPLVARWKAPKGAAYFQGFVRQGGAKHKFRVHGTWLVMPDDASLSVVVPYDVKGRRLKPVAVTVAPAEGAIAAAANPPKPVAPAAPAATAPTEPVPAAPEPEPTPAASEPEPTPTASEPATAQPAAPVGPTSVTAALALYFGTESVSLDSGRSELSTGNGIGGTAVSLAYARPASAWSGELAVALHTFEKTAETEAAGAGGSEDLDISVLETRLALAAGYALTGAADPGALRVDARAGLLSVKIPAFTDTLTTTGANEVGGASALGLLLGARARQPFGATALVAELAVAPLALAGAASLTAVDATLGAERALGGGRFFLLGAVDYRATSLTTKLDCGGCDGEGKARSTTTSLRLGGGARF